MPKRGSKPVFVGKKKFYSLRDIWVNQVDSTDTNRNVKARGRLKAWRRDIGIIARQAMTGEPWTGAVEISLRFIHLRPKSHFGTGRNADLMKSSAPVFKISKPDGVKMQRAVEDALTGIVYKDDSQIIDWRGGKRYGREEGVLIRARQIQEDTSQDELF
ncbi:MAG: RusA family crossover junction endodeoxyribonuclease [Propionibacteriaceae bacterium]|nr:RusA family crossover junction endodeoxyribonuclease [Propionibacteriaceae bacterium]